jgi:hypothetical protein
MIAGTAALRVLKTNLVQVGIFSPEQMAEWESTRKSEQPAGTA